MTAEGDEDRLFEAPSAPGTPIGRRCTLLESDGQQVVFFGTTVIHVFDTSDKAAEAACMAMLSRAGLASDVDIAVAFGVHRNTVGRLVARFSSDGMAAVVPAKRGPKGPSKVTPEVLAVIAGHADTTPARQLVAVVAERTGVELSLSYVQHLASLQHGHQLEFAAVDDDVDGDVAVNTSEEAVADEAGATDGVDEGAAFDPPPVLPEAVSGRYMGLALYFPALAAVGLIDVARSLFRLHRSERFGVRAVFQTLFFMTLLSRTTVESAKHLRRREFGAMIGTGRAPAVKTLRRKLYELVGQAKASEFGTVLARRWVESGIVATAYLYVDGHMKIYTGKRRLQEVWNSQRRMPLPGIHSYFVGDAYGRPLLFLAEALSANLAKALPRVVGAVREVVGDRRFTMIFDRGGYDGKLFAWLKGERIGFITYQRGNPKLPSEAFSRCETRFEGRRVRWFIAEDEVRIGGSGPWRRIVIGAKDGHQTPIITSLGPEIGAARIACLMFARWRQENLFKYMGEHQGLNCLASYAGGPADADTQIPNPERKRLDRQIAELRKQAAVRRAELGEALLNEPRENSRSAHGLKSSQRGAVKKLRQLEEQIDRLVAVRKPLPARVSVADAGTGLEVMQLEQKALIDRIKISAYNAEDWLCDRLIAHYPNVHDVRDLLRSFAELSGEIHTSNGKVDVILDPPDTPKHRRALRGLVADLNTVGATYPGTDIPVTYHVKVHHSEAAA